MAFFCVPDPTVVYEFESNGRHRILAARAMGYSIPVIVVGEISYKRNHTEEKGYTQGDLNRRGLITRFAEKHADKVIAVAQVVDMISSLGGVREEVIAKSNNGSLEDLFPKHI